MMVLDHDTNHDAIDEQLVEAWALVDELGEYSLRLKNAAEAAHEALGLKSEENP